MHDGRKTVIEKVWLAVSLSTFVLHRLMEATPWTEGIWFVEAMMIVLTFPFGILAMLFLALGVHELRGLADVGWILDWSTLLFIGYIQWFVVLPELRRNNEQITLNLTLPVETASPVKVVTPVRIASPLNIASPVETVSPVETPTPAPPSDSSTPPKAAPVVFNAAAFLPPLAEFDEAGLTALDKVLRAPQQTSPHALQVQPSCDEVIFPSVPARSRA